MHSGTCLNGALAAQGQRTAPNVCGSCDAGYVLANASCRPFGGTCANGEIVSPQSDRRQDNHCIGCISTHHLASRVCVDSGACTNGVLAAQTARTLPFAPTPTADMCGQCNKGFYLHRTGSNEQAEERTLPWFLSSMGRHGSAGACFSTLSWLSAKYTTNCRCEEGHGVPGLAQDYPPEASVIERCAPCPPGTWNPTSYGRWTCYKPDEPDRCMDCQPGTYSDAVDNTASCRAKKAVCGSGEFLVNTDTAVRTLFLV